MTMRAVQVSFFADPRGRRPEQLLEAWPALARVARATHDAGVRVTVLQASAYDAILERDGVTYCFVRQRGAERRVAVWPRKLIARAAALAPDVVHVHGLGYPLQTRMLARAVPDARLIIQDHCDHPQRGPRRRLQRWGLSAADAITFTAAEIADRFIRVGNLDPRVRILEVLEVSTEFTPGDVDDARRATGVDGDPCFLWVGRLNRNKDPVTIIEAFAIAARQLPKATLYMCYTDDSLLAEVRALIDSRPALQGRTHLSGKIPHAEMQDMYRSADFFVLGSAHEGSGFAILEAMASGVPPVVTDIPAFRAITGGEAGALFPCGDAAACADAMVRLARSDQSAQRRQTRIRFDNALTYRAIGVQLRNAYEAVMQ